MLVRRLPPSSSIRRQQTRQHKPLKSLLYSQFCVYVFVFFFWFVRASLIILTEPTILPCLALTLSNYSLGANPSGWLVFSFRCARCFTTTISAVRKAAKVNMGNPIRRRIMSGRRSLHMHVCVELCVASARFQCWNIVCVAALN